MTTMHTPQTIRAAATALCIAGAGLACHGSPTSPAAELTVSLRAIADGAFEMRVSNTGTGPVLLSGCPDAPSFVVERRDGERWSESTSFNVMCIAILTPKTLALAPGDTVVRRVDVAQRGTFRARLYVGPDYGRPQRVLTSGPVSLP